MQPLNEPNTSKTPLFHIFTISVQSRSERIFCLLSASLKKSEEWEAISFLHRSANLNFLYLKSSFITWMVYLDPTHWPAPSWLVSSVGRALHRYHRGHGFKSHTGLNFFQVLFSTTRFSSVLSCEDLLISRVRSVVTTTSYSFSLLQGFIYSLNLFLEFTEKCFVY